MAQAGDTVVLAGTRKGLFVLESGDRRRWRLRGPSFEGVAVNHAVLDPRDGRTVRAAVNSMHWGPTVARSADVGETWTKPAEGPAFPEGSGLSVDAVWHVKPGIADGEVWAGVEPAGLFRSVDDGATWQGVEGLNARPDRGDWMAGGGGLCLHTVLPDPRDATRMVVGISAAGILGSRDAGASWQLMNGRIRADWLPAKVTEESTLGSCPHKLVRDAADPEVLYMQNHTGVYRRRADDAAWTDISEGLPSRFGFPMAAHPRNGGTVYVLPLTGDFNRVTPDGAVAVWRTRDAGKTWERLAEGLPQGETWYTVLREGMATDTHDPAGVYFGTTTGHLYASPDEGDTWARIAEGLPPVVSVTAGVVA